MSNTQPSTPRTQNRRRNVIIGVVVVVILGLLVAFVGPIIYRDYIVGEAPEAPTVATASADPAGSDTTSESTLTDASGDWQVGTGSYAGYRVDEVLNGTDVTVVGRTEDVNGTFTVADQSLESGAITVDTASITTDEGRRDDYFRENTLRTSEFPTAEFTLTEPVDVAELLANGASSTMSVPGELTVAGETQPVTAELQAAVDGSGVQVAGSIPITFADFGVDAPDLGFVSVEPDGSVEFLLNLEQAAS